jgi:hypothetical protein
VGTHLRRGDGVDLSHTQHGSAPCACFALAPTGFPRCCSFPLRDRQIVAHRRQRRWDPRADCCQPRCLRLSAWRMILAVNVVAGQRMRRGRCGTRGQSQGSSARSYSGIVRIRGYGDQDKEPTRGANASSGCAWGGWSGVGSPFGSP